MSLNLEQTSEIDQIINDQIDIMNLFKQENAIGLYSSVDELLSQIVQLKNKLNSCFEEQIKLLEPDKKIKTKSNKIQENIQKQKQIQQIQAEPNNLVENNEFYNKDVQIDNEQTDLQKKPKRGRKKGVKKAKEVKDENPVQKHIGKKRVFSNQNENVQEKPQQKKVDLTMIQKIAAAIKNKKKADEQGQSQKSQDQTLQNQDEQPTKPKAQSSNAMSILEKIQMKKSMQNFEKQPSSKAKDDRNSEKIMHSEQSEQSAQLQVENQQQQEPDPPKKNNRKKKVIQQKEQKEQKEPDPPKRKSELWNSNDTRSSGSSQGSYHQKFML